MGRFSEGATESTHETGPLAELTSSAESSARRRSPRIDSRPESLIGRNLCSVPHRERAAAPLQPHSALPDGSALHSCPVFCALAAVALLLTR